MIRIPKVTMTMRELDRLKCIQGLIDGQLKQHAVATRLDRSFENQRYRASGLNLIVTAITLWNTVYMERALGALRADRSIEDNLVAHLSPLSWEHIHLTGDYVWHANKRVAKAVSDHFDAAARRHLRLSVLLFPFIEVTPNTKAENWAIGSSTN